MTSELNDMLKRSPLLCNHCMLHGSLCALLCHPDELKDNHWLDHLKQFLEQPSKQEQDALLDYAEKLRQQLEAEDFNLRLPDEFEIGDQRQKLEHLCSWIDGYIYSYATSRAIQNTPSRKEIVEWIDALQHTQRRLQSYLGKTPQQTTKKSTEDESFEIDFTEIVEFMRTCIYLCREIWHHAETQTHHPSNQSIH